MKTLWKIFCFLFSILVSPSQAGPLTTGIVYHPDYLRHEPGSGHPERPARLKAIMSHLQQQGVLDELVSIEAGPADEKWLSLVHPASYLRELEDAARHAPAYLDPDTGVSTQSYRVAVLAAGGLLRAVDAVMEGRVANAFVASRPPGHHALAARAMGFCLINNVAVAARYIQQKYDLKRVMIIDWDVHHGNGTQDIFYRDGSVFYFSTHQYPYYPGSGAADETGAGAGEGATLNVPLQAGAGDAEIERAFTEQLVPAADNFRPEFILISAGFDAHAGDPLAGLRVTEAGYSELTRIVMDIARRHAHGRIVSVLEGGYDLDSLAHSVEAHIRILQRPEPAAAK